MSDANVLHALDMQKGGYKRPSLNNIIIYGRVRCIISRPSIIGNTIIDGTGYYAIIDAYALKCLGEDYFRDEYSYDVNSVYFTRGSILIYIDSPKWVGKDVKVYGKSKSYGATIRRQECKNEEEGISAFMFGPPVRKGKWNCYSLVPNMLVELRSNDADTRGTVLEDFFVSMMSKYGKDVPYPSTLDSIIPYTGVSKYEEIDVSTLSDGNGKDDTSGQKTGNQGNAENPRNAGKFIKGDIDVSKIDMKLVFHLAGQDRSVYFDDFKEDIRLNAEERNVFVGNTLSDVYELYNADDSLDVTSLVSSFIENIAAEPQRKIGYGNQKAKTYILDFVENMYSSFRLTEEFEGRRYNDFETRQIKEEIDYLKKNVLADYSLLYGNDDEVADIPMLMSSREFLFILNATSVCSGIKYDDLVGNFLHCARTAGMSWEVYLYCLLKTPYILGMLGTGLKVPDCDVLCYSLGKVFGKDDNGDVAEINKKYRSYMIMLDTLNSCMKGMYKKGFGGRGGINTFVKITDFKRADKCYSQVESKYAETYGFMCKPENIDLLTLWLGGKRVSLSKEDKGYLLGKDWYDEKTFDELQRYGIINTLDGYCALERVIEQEFMIYETFEEMGKLPTGITDEVIDEVVNLFEEDRGFKLEGLQREGIKLCKMRAGVLSGCAGSGKTTTSDCMTEVLKTLGDKKIIYCAPTGKACRRLAEVVKGTVKTIHSQFGVSVGGSSYLQGAYKSKASREGSGNIYILDEMAMCSTELMYSVARNISDKDIIYFLGDVKQLPPIGGGCPFKVLMTVLPCVELGVSKRAAEGSLVNYNTSLINFMSDGICAELKYDDKSFIAHDCSDETIVSTVNRVFMNFIEGKENGTKYSEDDIQVISGYQKKEKLSSTVRLNKPIQENLRRNDRVLYYKERRVSGEELNPFYKNDRVIYVNKNSYDICRYIMNSKGEYVQVPTFGCVNGEMGKLVDIVRTDKVVIHKFSVTGSRGNWKWGSAELENLFSQKSEEDIKQILDRFEGKKDSLRVDNGFVNDSYYFVVVKVYDSDLECDVYCLLRGRGRNIISDGRIEGQNSLYSSPDGNRVLALSGQDLDNLMLAYALTCHKMQGSQSPVVIAVFESGGSPDFINRNMINTIITRSQGVVCCVGSVLGEDSMLNRGRKRISNTECRDILSVLSGTDTWLD